MRLSASSRRQPRQSPTALRGLRLSLPVSVGFTVHPILHGSDAGHMESHHRFRCGFAHFCGASSVPVHGALPHGQLLHRHPPEA